MRDLASEMGIKAASLYNHISSKQDILTTIILSIAEEFTKGMDAIMNSGDNTLNKLNNVISLHVKITSDNTYGMASLNNDWMHLEEQLEYYLKLRHNYEDNFRKIIRQGIGSGDIIDENPETILFSILSTLRSLYLWIPKKEKLDTQELTSSLSIILINGIDKKINFSS